MPRKASQPKDKLVLSHMLQVLAQRLETSQKGLRSVVRGKITATQNNIMSIKSDVLIISLKDEMASLQNQIT